MLNKMTKSIALAVVSGGILAATISTPALARDGGGPEFRPNCHTAGCPHVKKKIKKVRKARVKKGRKKSRPWAQSYDRRTGRTITSIGNGDGSRTVIGVGAGFGPFGIQIWTSN
ncbi:MAG: hypothetical protein AB3N20_02355 [Rhizobiaceae bacterium]